MKGKMMGAEGEEGVDQLNARLLQEDDTFKPFLEDDFEAEKYAAKLISSIRTEEALSRLLSGIQLLDNELHTQVVSKHDDLLQQATGIQKLDDVLNMINLRVGSLQSSLERIRQRIEEPHQAMSTRTTQLANLQMACDILRRTSRFLYVSKRLKEQLNAGPRELAKAAQSLAELDEITSVDLSGVTIVERERAWTRQERNNVINKASKILRDGLDSQNQSDIATALQIFYSLGAVHLQDVVKSTVKTLEDALSTDIRGVFKNAAMDKTGGVNWRKETWAQIDALLGSMFTVYSEVTVLARVLAKKKDPVTHTCFIDFITKEGEAAIVNPFWETIAKLFKSELSRTSSESSIVRQMLESEYPRLLRAVNELRSRVTALSPSSGSMLAGAVVRFESVYVGRSAARMADTVNMMFTGHMVPSREQVSNLCKVVKSDLQVANCDEELAHAIANNVAKAVRLFIAKSESLTSFDEEAWPLHRPPLGPQLRNIDAVNCIGFMRVTVLNSLDESLGLTQSVKDVVIQAMDGVLAFIDTMLQDLFVACDQYADSFMVRMHNQNFNTASGGLGEQPCSQYVLDLIAAMRSLNEQYLARFASHMLSAWRIDLAARLAQLFVRHLSLIRPLSDDGKLRVASDMANFESVLAPIMERTNKKLPDIGIAYRSLRTFRLILFIETDKLDVDSKPVRLLDPVTVLHHCFSRAPREMPSPYQVMQCSVGQYCRWIDSHAARDVLSAIQGCVEVYKNEVTNKQAKEFAPIYPFMIAILKQAAASKLVS